MKPLLEKIVLFGIGLTMSLAGLTACSMPAPPKSGSSMNVPTPTDTHSDDWKAGHDQIIHDAGQIPHP